MTISKRKLKKLRKIANGSNATDLTLAFKPRNEFVRAMVEKGAFSSGGKHSDKRFDSKNGKVKHKNKMFD